MKILKGLVCIVGFIVLVGLATMVVKFVWVRTDAGYGTISEGNMYVQELIEEIENLTKRLDKIEDKHWGGI